MTELWLGVLLGVFVGGFVGFVAAVVVMGAADRTTTHPRKDRS